jgi:hypothetical protein
MDPDRPDDEENEGSFEQSREGISQPQKEQSKTQATEIHLDKIFSKFFKLFKGIFSLIIKAYKPLLILLLLGLVFLGGYSLKFCQVCEEPKVCEECITCPELDCNSCPIQTEKVTTIRYACQNGLVVDDLKECDPLNHIEITSNYKETENGVTLSIDNLEYEMGEGYGKITQIDYTIINSKNHEIKPIVLVNIYSLTDGKLEQGLVHEVFDDEEYIDSDSWAIKKKETNISFKGEKIVVRLVLKDTLPDPDKIIVRVIRDLGI